MSPNHNQRPVISDDKDYNPYTDPRLTECKPEQHVDIDTREPFNDAVRHQDIIVGHQRNRTLSDYPKRARPWIRLYAIATLILIIGGILWSYVH